MHACSCAHEQNILVIVSTAIVHVFMHNSMIDWRGYDDNKMHYL